MSRVIKYRRYVDNNTEHAIALIEYKGILKWKYRTFNKELDEATYLEFHYENFHSLNHLAEYMIIDHLDFTTYTEFIKEKEFTI